MPLYEYQCADCGAWDQRIGGLDDDTALCSQCNGIMIRVTLDIFQGYFTRESDRLKQIQVKIN